MKILQTKIFNDSERVLQPQKPKIIIKRKLRSTSTPKRPKTPVKLKKNKLNTSKGSIKVKKSSRNNSTSKVLKNHNSSYSKNRRNSKIFDVTRITNWKYEVKKLIRTVFRHYVLCQSLQDEAKEMGGLKILDEYKKYNN